jgi:hypothetical protein
LSQPASATTVQHEKLFWTGPGFTSLIITRFCDILTSTIYCTTLPFYLTLPLTTLPFDHLHTLTILIVATMFTSFTIFIICTNFITAS